MRRKFLALLLLSALLALGLWSCDSASPLAPAGTILVVTASPSKIDLDGQSTITIQGFRPNGSLLNPGTQILVSTDLGNLQPLTGSVPGGVSIVEMSDDGRARVRLVADGRAGTATVTASTTGASGGGEGGASSVSVQIGEDASTAPSLVISANPTSIAVLGSSQISILGRNSDSTPVAAGERIRLTVDLGDLTCDGAGGCREVFTDENGEAEAIFVAGDLGGTGRVAAILGTSDEATVNISIRDAVASILLTANPQSVQRIDGPTGATVQLTALLQNAQGEPVSGTTVSFESQFGSVNPTQVVSNSQGNANSTLTVTRQDLQSVGENGTFIVRASGISEGEGFEASVPITVLGSP